METTQHLSESLSISWPTIDARMEAAGKGPFGGEKAPPIPLSQGRSLSTGPQHLSVLCLPNPDPSAATLHLSDLA